MINEDLLSYFTDLFETIKVYEMHPVGNKWSKRTYVGNVKGVIESLKQNRFNVENGTWNETEVLCLWCRERLPIGRFIERNKELFRIIDSNDWEKHGNYYRYEIENFVGTNDTQTKENIPINDYE